MNNKTKYGAIRTVYNGDSFHSKKEANYAKKLDILKGAVGNDRVIKYEKQVSFNINVNNEHICKYILDFKVTYPNRVEYIDVKGYKKGVAYQMFKIKKKLVETLYSIKIIEI